MAYAATVTVRRLEDGLWHIDITETEAGASTETALVDTTTGLKPPPVGRILRVKQARSSGTGANRTPKVLQSTGATGVGVAYEAAATAVATVVDDAPTGGAQYRSGDPAGKLYYRSVYDAGADNAGTVQIMIATGWV